MAKASTPSSVGDYTFDTTGSKGKHHPSGVGGDRQGVKVISGSSPSGVKAGGSATSRIPGGVKRGDGTEQRAGSNAPKSKTRSRSPAQKGGTKDHRPAKVKVADQSGIKVRQSAK